MSESPKRMPLAVSLAIIGVTLFVIGSLLYIVKLGIEELFSAIFG